MNNRNGIAIVGLNGSGKSTLGHMLAKETGYHEMDVEDYFFPEQRESRRNALEALCRSPPRAEKSRSRRLCSTTSACIRSSSCAAYRSTGAKSFCRR